MTMIFSCEYRLRNRDGYNNDTLKEYVEKLYDLGYTAASDHVQVIEYETWDDKGSLEEGRPRKAYSLEECLQSIEKIGAEKIMICFPHSGDDETGKKRFKNTTTDLYVELIELAERYRQEKGNDTGHRLYMDMIVGIGFEGFHGPEKTWGPRIQVGGDGYVSDSEDFPEYLLRNSKRLQELNAAGQEIFKTELEPVMAYES